MEETISGNFYAMVYGHFTLPELIKNIIYCRRFTDKFFLTWQAVLDHIKPKEAFSYFRRVELIIILYTLFI